VTARVPVTDRLPVFPWDRLTPYKHTAADHPGGLVDLSVGTPVDPVPAAVQAALAEAADAPGYPTTHGIPELRRAAADYLSRRHGVAVTPEAVLPTIGSKEFVGWLPTLLGLGPGDGVAYPELSYPSYDIGVRLAGAQGTATDSLLSLGPAQVKLVWLNSPANPSGRVLPPEHLAKVVAWARERGAVVACDECYIDLGWEGTPPVSILHPDVCGDTHDGVLAVHSLSKRSNLAGYRAGFVTGDPRIIAELLEVRKHAGMIMPAPVQAAMRAALDDDSGAAEQKERYARRRALLRPALEAAGWRIDHSEAGLYLWAHRPGLGAWKLDRLFLAGAEQLDGQGFVLLAFEEGPHLTSYHWDSDGRLNRLESWTGQRRETAIQLEYDDHRRLVAARSDNGNSVRYVYDRSGNLTRVERQDVVLQYQYANGLVTGVQDGHGAVHRFAYNDLGQLTSQQLPDGTRQQCVYDSAADGRPRMTVRIRDRNGINVERQVSEEGSATVQWETPGGQRHRMALRPEQRQLFWQLPSGGIYCFERDARGRIARVLRDRQPALEQAWTELGQLSLLCWPGTVVEGEFQPNGTLQELHIRPAGAPARRRRAGSPEAHPEQGAERRDRPGAAGRAHRGRHR
jgi:succinyldiaminopimelate transaminase